jgi:hypothetical protein
LPDFKAIERLGIDSIMTPISASPAWFKYILIRIDKKEGAARDNSEQ